MFRLRIRPTLGHVSMDYAKHLLPDVPVELMKYVCATESIDEFVRSGFEVASMFDLACKRYGHKTISGFRSILDFGCGCGRLVRFIQPQGGLFGCDVNRRVADYCKANYPHGSFYQNDLLPPLIYRDGLFDLVYSFSVFSHLREDVEIEWLREIVRVGAPGCVYLITIHGDWVIEAVLGSEADAARQSGFYYKNVHRRSNQELDFPDYYEASFHTSDYIRRRWAQYFDVLDVIKGDDPARYLFDADAGSRELIRTIRPMGQDLVVAVKR